MNVKVIVEYIINNVATQEDLDDLDMTLEDITKILIRENGIIPLAEDPDGKIVSVELFDKN